MLLFYLICRRRNFHELW
ncbi:hypothetical protein AB3N60_11720 [Leptospira sp. WS39.C2]